MRAIALHDYGGPSALRETVLPRPTPGEGQVLVAVAFAGLNPADWKFREGYNRAFFEPTFPFVIGFDAAGTIAALGPGVDGLNVGQRIVTPSNLSKGASGSYAQHLVADADRVAPVPDALPLSDAAALPVAALTAWQALFDADRGDLKAGQRVFINGGAGGLGSFAIQFARAAGAHVATTCGPGNLDYVTALGAERAIDYTTEPVIQALKDWAPSGVDLLLDAVGSDSLPQPETLVTSGGRLVSIPTLVRDAKLETIAASAAERGVQHVFAFMNDVDCSDSLAHIAQRVAAGDIRMPPVEVVPFSAISAAHERLQEGHVRGKLVMALPTEE